MGHFGRRPIRLAWYAVVFPALLLNYFGQGALLLEHPEAARRTRSTRWSPRSLVYPLVALATAATVIASQALISGAFSLTQQAVQLGFFPRVTIVHTSGDAEGQIYIPEINWALMVACIALVLAFQRVDARSPRRTASPSPARWPSPRSSTTSWSPRRGAGPAGRPPRSSCISRF